jgi:nucleoside-diphosphate-sugar epimerase
MAPCPLSPYALQKYEGEQYCLLFSRLFGLETVSLRYFNVFGPGQDPGSPYAAVIPRFIEALIKGSAPVVFGDGEQSRDFIFIEDLVRGNLLAMAKDHVHGEVINLCSGKGCSLNRLLAHLSDILRRNVKAQYLEARPGDVRHSLGDPAKARQILGYIPKVEIKTGLERTVSEYGKKGKKE